MNRLPLTAKRKSCGVLVRHASNVDSFGSW
jgi:hypothetical protein